MASPAIGRRPRWTPPATATIDRQHPLAQGLLAYVVPGVTMTELATGVRGTINGSSSLSRGSYGPAINGVTSSTVANALDWGNTPGDVGGLTDASFTCLFTVVTLGSDTTFFGRWSNTGGQRTWLMFNQAGTNQCRLATSTASSSISIVAGPAIAAGGTYLVTAVRSGSTVTMYANGLAASSGATTAGTFNSPAAAAPLRMVDTHAAANTGTTLYTMGCVHNRALTASEVQALYADPFQLLRY